MWYLQEIMSCQFLVPCQSAADLALWTRRMACGNMKETYVTQTNKLRVKIFSKKAILLTRSIVLKYKGFPVNCWKQSPTLTYLLTALKPKLFCLYTDVAKLGKLDYNKIRRCMLNYITHCTVANSKYQTWLLIFQYFSDIRTTVQSW